MGYSRILPFFMTLCISCGAETNINGTLFSIDGSNDSIASKFTQARTEYNVGNYTKAENLTRDILKIDPDHSDAALLLSNVLLGKAGVNPFDVTIKLISLQTTSLAESEAGVSNLFSELAGILNITDEDLVALGTLNTDDFSDLPVLVPNKLDGSENDPRNVVEVLRLVNEAIGLLCPFVSENLRANAADDARHDCTASTQTSTIVAKHDLAWAIAHLTEAVAFNAALTYTTSSESTELGLNPLNRSDDAAATTSSNLLLRVNRMQSTTPSSLSELATFTSQMSTINTLFSAVFDTSEQGMLNATMDDITAITDAFAGIAGMPESVTKQLTSTFDQLTSAAEQTTGNSGDELTANDKVEAFREEMQSGMASTLATSVDSSLTTISADISDAELEEFNTNKTAVCENLDAIINYESDTTQTDSLPDGCL